MRAGLGWPQLIARSHAIHPAYVYHNSNQPRSISPLRAVRCVQARGPPAAARLGSAAVREVRAGAMRPKGKTELISAYHRAAEDRDNGCGQAHVAGTRAGHTWQAHGPGTRARHDQLAGQGRHRAASRTESAPGHTQRAGPRRPCKDVLGQRFAWLPHAAHCMCTAAGMQRGLGFGAVLGAARATSCVPLPLAPRIVLACRHRCFRNSLTPYTVPSRFTRTLPPDPAHRCLHPWHGS